MRRKDETPVIIGNATPFRLILRDEDKWEPTIDDINDRTYDYVKLHRVSKFINVGIDPFPLAFGFDGSLILPAIRKYQDKDIVLDIFNSTLGRLLFGGIYSEAVLPENVAFGRLTFDGYYAHLSGGNPGTITQFHRSILNKLVGQTDAIYLLHPPVIKVSDLEKSFYKGKVILDKIPRLSASILLNGVTYFVKHQWTESLISLWTSIEQIISHIWDCYILNKVDQFEVVIPKRKEFLQDYRTWTTSTKIEMLYQKNMIGSGEYTLLNKARRARNDFIHEGIIPKKAHSEATLDALLSLISLTVTDFHSSNNLNEIREIITMHVRRELIPKGGKIEGKVTHWLAIPPIPGDPGWGDKEYEMIEDIQLKILDEETIKSINPGLGEEELSRLLDHAASLRKK